MLCPEVSKYLNLYFIFIPQRNHSTCQFKIYSIFPDPDSHRSKGPSANESAIR